MGSTPEKIAIIGGGLAGLVLALTLSKLGIKSTIYEQRPEGEKLGTYIQLAPNALRVLDDLGLYAKILHKGYSYEKATVANSSGAILGSSYLGHEKLFGFPALRVARSSVREELLDALRKTGTEICYGKLLNSLSEREDGVMVTFEDGSSVRADLVVGADGLRSAVRRYIDPVAEPYHNGVTIIYGSIHKKDISSEALESIPIPGMISGLRGSFVVIPTDEAGDDIGFFGSITLPDRSWEEWKEFQLDYNQQFSCLQEEFCQDTWPETVRAICKQVDVKTISAWPIFVLPRLLKWSTPSRRIVVIGDAAHGLSPFATQGAGQALDDAQTLAYALSMNNTIDSLQETLKTWEDHRVEFVRRVIEYSTALEAKRKPSSNRLMQAVKEWATWGFLKYHGEEGAAAWINRYDGKLVMRSLL